MYGLCRNKFMREGVIVLRFIKMPRNILVPTTVGNAADYGQQCYPLLSVVMPTTVSIQKNPEIVGICSGISIFQ